MKTYSDFLQILLIPMLLFSLNSCSDDDDMNTPPVEEPMTVADFVASNDNYSSLAAALEVAGLTATLDGTASYTVFAPDNDAFAAFLADNRFSSLEEVPEEILTQILLNHVQSGEIRAADLSTGYIESMATGAASEENLSMYINTSNGVMINGVSTVENADIEVANGIIHAVDAVIGLPDITTFALADPTFDILVAALTREEDYTFVSTLMSSDAPAPFTVFAPTNDAFAAFLEEMNFASLDEVPADILATTLSYHVVPSANVRSTDLTDAMVVNTLIDQSFTVNLGDNVVITDASGRTSTVIATDVQATNGVIHVLDTVLLPQF
ncbi:fasciclin domain-containing protein [Salinimicrobium catena]|uniref:fasciclin domain-containing protein n=1 Tax=Salinimicrobium catena TaxID=390640 RepID=UPI002FE4BAA6